MNPTPGIRALSGLRSREDTGRFRLKLRARVRLSSPAPTTPGSWTRGLSVEAAACGLWVSEC
ncbi:hypothetical protein STVIR_1852 [Streptomyces viridochromogenes Tue57]|uniref:Uncharacterized protein n=1 Tax=Streptomyces viridochromogenes Tue57 TaxID=1160705 RepID=L8PP72_STRVR|nr:hypothetical protein STVIR_1852 [Streptomyces viridochromogenes Tue57]